MSVLPNCYYAASNQSGSVAAHYLNSQTLFNTQTVLSYLTTALRISVANYQLTHQSSPAPTPTQPQNHASTAPTSHPLSNALELAQTHEENKEINQNTRLNSQKSTPAKPVPLDEKETRKEPQTATDDELLQEEREKALKKTQFSRRTAKKVKEPALNDFVVPLPEIDLIETAYLPLFSPGNMELAKKREEIMRRRVENWGDMTRSRKDKREIRMLTN